jgi:hypothetical protein
VNKADFIEKAPMYYAAMLAWALQKHRSISSGGLTIEEINSIVDTTYLSELRHRPLIQQALTFLEAEGAVNIHTDDFGPQLIYYTTNFPQWWEQLGPRSYPLIRLIKGAKDPRAWLITALAKVNDQYDQLNIKAADFTRVDKDIEWEPLPLDRNDETLIAATKAL